MAVTTSAAAEHHVAAVHRALVHLSQMHRAEVDLEGPLVAECLQTDVALDTFFPGGRIDKCCAQVFVESAVLSGAVVHASSFGRHHVVLIGHKILLCMLCTAPSTPSTLPICNSAASAEIHWIVRAMAGWSSGLLFEFPLIGRHCSSCHSSFMKLDHRVVMVIRSHEARHKSAVEGGGQRVSGRKKAPSPSPSTHTVATMMEPHRAHGCR